MKVLDRLEEWGLKVSIDKCQFCQPQVKYVGHIVSAAGIAPDPEKVSVLTRWEEPTDLKSLRSFLGFCGFYCRFIKGYSSVVRPLTELTKGYPPVKGSGKKNAKNYYMRRTHLEHDGTKPVEKPSKPLSTAWPMRQYLPSLIPLCRIYSTLMLVWVASALCWIRSTLRDFDPSPLLAESWVLLSSITPYTS